MKRSPPSVSESQSKSIADYSKQKALSDASHERILAMRGESEQIQEMLEHELQSQGKFAKWFPRVMIFPIAYMALWGGFITIRGVLTGMIPAIARNSGVPVPPVLRISEPIYFWISIVAHSAMTALFIYMSIRIFAMTGWFRKSEA